jgi:drug/metabolite transporter (DMT)-like permease
LNLGYLYAFGAFLAIGSYLVPSRFARSKGLAFLPVLGAGLLVCVLPLLPWFLELARSPRWLLATFLSGLLWCAGQSLAGLALEEMSLAKAAAVFNVNTLINLAAGILLFGEAGDPSRLPGLLLGGALLFAGAVWVAWAQAVPRKERDLRKGLLLSLGAALCWGVYFLPLVALRRADPASPLTGLHTLSGLMVGGGVAALAVGFLGRWRIEWRKDAPHGFASAVLWTVGTFCFLAAIERLGLARTVPVVNTNVLMYALWSFAVFKELPWSQAPRVLGGCLLLAVGIALLAGS